MVMKYYVRNNTPNSNNTPPPEKSSPTCNTPKLVTVAMACMPTRSQENAAVAGPPPRGAKRCSMPLEVVWGLGGAHRKRDGGAR